MEFYKMADCCRPEVDSDVISDQKVGTIQVNIVTKFEGPSSNRIGAIKFAHGRYDGDDDGVRVSSHYAQTNYVGSGVKIVWVTTGLKLKTMRGPLLKKQLMQWELRLITNKI